MDHAHEYLDGRCVVCAELESARPAVWSAVGRTIIVRVADMEEDNR